MNELRVSPVFLANKMAFESDNYKIIVNQGGTRSGKTYSIMQLLILTAHLNNLEISVVSKTLPHIKKGCLRDFKKIMVDLNIFDEKKFNKTDLIYKFSETSFIEFFSADDGAKLRGPGRDILFVNEANLLTKDEWKQLLLRTRQKAFIDYNPVDEFHWIYDDIIPRNDCKFIQSSYLENYDFLNHDQINEIERLRDEDNNYWKVFGLGERATSTNLIYPNFRVQHFFHEGETFYGLDFGYNNPTALVKCSVVNNNLFVEQIIHETQVTNSTLIEMINSILGNSVDFIYCDSAEPARIEELKQAGFNVWPADKNVKTGIDYVKRFSIIINPESIDLIKEIKSYKWKEDKNGIILEEPVKYNDHCLDALRYAVFSHRKYLDTVSTFNNFHLEKLSKPRNNKYSSY